MSKAAKKPIKKEESKLDPNKSQPVVIEWAEKNIAKNVE